MSVARFQRTAVNASRFSATITARVVAQSSVRLRALVLVAVLSACSREPVAPSGAATYVPRQTPRAEVASVVPVGALLDSFSIGGVYTVLPRGGYWGGSSYDWSPRKEQYAGMVWKHPTGLVLPVGLPIRILAKGQYVSSATAAFQQDYCSVPSHATDPRCAVGSFTYTIHGLADGPGVMRPYEAGMGLALTWLHIAGYYERFYGLFPSAEFFRGRVPAADTASVSTNPCYRSDVVSADTKKKIMSHEGAAWELDPVSHAGKMRQLAFERLPAAAESVYTKLEAGGRQGFMNRWHVLVYEGVEAKIDSLSNKPVDQQNPVYFGSGSRFGCKFAFPSR